MATGQPLKKRGRPSKEDMLQKLADEQRNKILSLKGKRGNIAKTPEGEIIASAFKCTKCGTVVMLPEGFFYSVNTNDALESNGGRSAVCITCANQYFDEYKERYKDEKLALMLTCVKVGHYFSEQLYERMRESEKELRLGEYFRYLNGKQYEGKNFTSYMIELYKKQQTFSAEGEVREVLEEAWAAPDRKNKNYCLKELGYDPFSDPAYTSIFRVRNHRQGKAKGRLHPWRYL